MLYHLIAFALAFVLDMIFGDPRGIPHPVIYIGKMITLLEKKLLIEKDEPFLKRRKGRWLVVIVLMTTGIISGIFVIAAYFINIYLGIIVEAIFSATCLAARDLTKESMKVHYALKNESLEKARYAVSMIVGRDTKCLTEEGVTKAAIETVAESTSDGVIAPMIYLAIGGPVLGLLYKAVNTMDSMLGYKNDKYLDFGRAAALTDDFFNFLPARISGLLMVAASGLLPKRFDIKNSWKIFKRDRLKHHSPNSAHTEAAAAGALEVQLAGPAVYFGKLVEKDYLGDKINDVKIDDIKRVNILMLRTSILAYLLLNVVLILTLYLKHIF